MFCAMIRAEVINTAQNFKSMNDLGTLTFESGNKVGRTDFVTYTCSGSGATFGIDRVESKISICLPNKGNTVTTTRIDELTGFSIMYNPYDVNRTNLKVRLSRDGETWGDPLTGDNISYSDGSVSVTIPRNNYFVQIYNNASSKDVFIMSITYYQDHCNCFVYEP